MALLCVRYGNDEAVHVHPAFSVELVGRIYYCKAIDLSSR